MHLLSWRTCVLQSQIFFEIYNPLTSVMQVQACILAYLSGVYKTRAQYTSQGSPG